MIRDLRRADTPALFALMTREFPQESTLLGGRPEEFEKIARRALRWDTRFLVGLLRLFGHPIFRVLIVESEKRVAGLTMLSFSRVSTFVSTVVVDPAYRRRGFARQLLEEARRTAKKTDRKYLVLGVIDTNTPARTLYESTGYRRLQAQDQLLIESADRVASPPSPDAGIRPFRRGDTPALMAIVRARTSPSVQEVLPISKQDFLGFALANRVMATEEAGWTIDRGRGPEGQVSASVSRAFEAAHLSAPVIAESVDPGLAEALVRTAVAWCASRKAPRVLSMVTDDNPRGRAALEAAGFRHAFALTTLYRPVD
jgi:ribosomal protein S18 acetylase RimI-like enzyme